jgi:hypothetical protein
MYFLCSQLRRFHPSLFRSLPLWIAPEADAFGRRLCYLHIDEVSLYTTLAEGLEFRV